MKAKFYENTVARVRPAPHYSLSIFIGLALVVATAFRSLAAPEFANPKDGFADKLTIPTGTALRDPSHDTPTDKPPLDAFQTILLASSKTTSTNGHAIVPSVPSLRLLALKHRPLLMRYLSASPAWRVYEQRGGLFATRRWKLNGDWQWKMHGYYTSDDSTNYFQSRTAIAFNQPWVGQSPNATRVPEGTNKIEVLLTRVNTPDASHTIIDCDGLFLELFEESNVRERRLTKTALAFLEKEFGAVLERGAWSSELLEPGALHHGTSSCDVKNGMQPGIYQTFAWLNPGEAGTVYLRAYEITRNTRLSESNLFADSNEQIGWSETPTDLFLYNAEFMIFEGDWGKAYAARFEIWFRPASGGPERKLTEGNFRIEGWQR